jgi:hypothetical protein
MAPASQRLAEVVFGRFQVLPDRRAFDVVMALIEARRKVVSKD